MKNCLSNLLSFLKWGEKTPEIKENTFLLWEPCSQSHSEVIPGYAKYLLDLGYHVSVLITPQRYQEGLFSRFEESNISYNKISQKNIRKFFEKNDLSNIKGAMITTVGKLCTETDLEEAYTHFHSNVDKKKLLFVEHDAKVAIDENRWNEKVITLRSLNYKNAKSVVVNPHYFGKVKITPKNNEITNFVTIGAINPKRKNSTLIIDAVKSLYEKGISNFKVTVIGKGQLKGVPKELHKFFDIKGRLPFDKMYDEIEKADFMLTAYDDKNEQHQRYNTVGTSGNFQLIYGFLKPCIIIESFAQLNGYNTENSILYKSVNEYADAMEKAINVTSEDYTKMQDSLKNYAENLYNESLNNLRRLING